MKKEKLLSISEMAKLRHVTTETLRHYDRIGLLRPVYVDPANGYRYYSITQYEELGTIRELRQLGMSLAEIQNFLDNRTLSTSLEQLRQLQSRLQREIAEKQKVEKIIAEKIDFMESLVDLPETAAITQEEYPVRYMLCGEEILKDICALDMQITRLEGILNEISPILASNRVGAMSEQNIGEIHDMFPFTPFIFCEQRYQQHPKFRQMPAGHYLTTCYHGRFGEDASIFQTVSRYMKAHGLRQDGPFYQNYEIDITITSNLEETMLRLQVPVKLAAG